MVAVERPAILIVGSGAMACLFGARLSPHTDVTLLGTWPEGVAAVRDQGIQLETDGKETVARVRATSDPAECSGTRLAIVLVKSWQTKRAARQLEACLAPEGVAVTLQNGLGNLFWLENRLGSERAAQGVTMAGATLLGPGHVRAGGEGLTYLASHPRLPPIADLLRRAGLAVEVVEDLESLVWGKAVVSAAINPLTALLRVPNGGLLAPAPSSVRILAAEAANEAAAVAAARGVHLPFAQPRERVFEVAQATLANRSSMLQDVECGRPTEIDAINGMITSEGERLGVPTPVNRVLWHLVRSLSPSTTGEQV
jgi:2-dehydropantoate 2-reductase